jgi:hypothetical protein
MPQVIKIDSRETLEIKPETLYNLISNSGWGSNPTVDGFIVVEDKITSSDAEDGGADHDIIIKELATDKFFKGGYTDWDMDNTDYDEEDDEIGDRCDLNTSLIQVFPKQVTVTIYE